MRITNDSIQFEAADFSALSDFAKRALTPYAGTTPFETLFANQLNEHIRIAKLIAKQTAAEDPKVDAVLAGLAIADDVQRLAAQPCLDQLVAVLPSALLPGGEKILPMPEVSIK